MSQQRMQTELADDHVMPRYSIEEAAARAGVHVQTLRHYERLELIAPARRGERPQSPRLYSERDIEQVIRIRALVRDLGVNPVGAAMVLRLRDRAEQLLASVAALEATLDRERRVHAEEAAHLRARIARLERQ